MEIRLGWEMNRLPAALHLILNIEFRKMDDVSGVRGQVNRWSLESCKFRSSRLCQPLFIVVIGYIPLVLNSATPKTHWESEEAI